MCASVFRTLIGLSIGFTAAALAQVGLFIIAIFYGDPLNPTRPEYLGVVGVFPLFPSHLDIVACRRRRDFCCTQNNHPCCAVLAVLVAYYMRRRHVNTWKAYVFIAG